MPEPNTDHHNKYYNQQISTEKWKEEFYNKTVHQLKTEERFITYFKQFDPISVETFIKSYARQKVEWFSAGNNLKKWEQSKSTQWMKSCFIALIEIQQKKLFNAQCLWRAEKIKLPGIGICYDFRYWEDHIFACHDIPPITEAEIDLYTCYLKETPCNEPFDELKNYQDYEEFVNQKNEAGDAFWDNPWYSYYDSKEGTESYFGLTDIRSDKEEKYMDIYRKDYNEKHRQEIETRQQNQDTKPYLSRFDNDFMSDFVKRHETPAFYRMYLQSESESQLNEMNEKADYSIGMLEEIPLDYLAIEPADDWRVAVALTYERYRREKVIALLPQAFEIYLKHLGHDWKYPGRNERRSMDDDPYKGISRMFFDMIIQGRVLNGEPADLNF